ncbi:MAG: Signal peptidase I, partial [uncultured Acidimicrobiales bacterium]
GARPRRPGRRTCRPPRSSRIGPAQRHRVGRDRRRRLRRRPGGQDLPDPGVLHPVGVDVPDADRGRPRPREQAQLPAPRRQPRRPGRVRAPAERAGERHQGPRQAGRRPRGGDDRGAGRRAVRRRRAPRRALPPARGGVERPRPHGGATGPRVRDGGQPRVLARQPVLRADRGGPDRRAGLRQGVAPPRPRAAV